ncbi:sulfite exporter TauE/SafE family protein [Pseudahrensia aquimaris]|uniref:Probable membrane transporter protein n=1 Tax=Pseudahrensia aquimaris TaxID=744461 RepID=A0ABW3FH14_9HYPH
MAEPASAFPLYQAVQSLAAATELSPWTLAAAVGVVFVAGMVRGFSGFALSALVMASLALVIPPVELIAVCWVLELSASVLMIGPGLVKGDSILAQASLPIVFGLMIGGLVGQPAGLWFTTVVAADVSKAAALSVIIVLAVLQLLKVRSQFLATKPGLWFSGAMAGVATGLASVGGMVVALYVLSQGQGARNMRASLVTYLFANSFFGLALLLWFGMMDGQALTRGLVLTLPCLIGVVIGKMLFTPRLEPYYKPFCLLLLMGLASAGLMRLVLGA